MHLLILLGPSLFGPRYRILLTIDGLKVQAWDSGTEGETSVGYEDENQFGGRGTGGTLNHVRRLDQVRSPLSLIPPPATGVLNGNDPTGPEHAEDHTSMDSAKSSDSSCPPSGESPTGYLGEQQALSAAERLLSRSLAMACAEDGVTLNAELGPGYFSAAEPKY